MLKKYIHISFRFIKLELNKKSPGDSISNLGDGEGSFDDGLLPPVMIHFFNITVKNAVFSKFVL